MKPVGKSSHKRKQIPTTNTNLDLINVDHVPSSGTHSGSNVMLYVFEDNEAMNLSSQCSDKFLIREKSECIQKSGDTHSYGET